MKKLLALIAVLALLLGLSTVVWASGEIDQAQWDASIFEAPENLFKAGYDGIECMDIDLGLYHLIPARNGSRGDYFFWTGRLEKMPELTEDNGGCFTPPTLVSDTVIFWDGVPNLSKNLFRWAEDTVKVVYIPDTVKEIDEDCFVMGSTITLHFTKNNAVALAYAEARGMNYEIVPEPADVSDPSEPDTSDPDTSEPSEPDISDLDTSDPSAVPHGILLGDADGDSDVTMKDVLLVREFIANMDVSINKTATDLNADGSTDMKDVLALRKQIATAA